jgi:hypothetical protein
VPFPSGPSRVKTNSVVHGEVSVPTFISWLSM